MNRPPDDSPVYPLALRKALMIACAVPAITAFVAVLVHHKGLVDVEQFGIPENKVGPWPASLGWTTNSYSSINPSSARAIGSFTPPVNSPLPDSRLSC